MGGPIGFYRQDYRRLRVPEYTKEAGALRDEFIIKLARWAQANHANVPTVINLKESAIHFLDSLEKEREVLSAFVKLTAARDGDFVEREFQASVAGMNAALDYAYGRESKPASLKKEPEAGRKLLQCDICGCEMMPGRICRSCIVRQDAKKESEDAHVGYCTAEKAALRAEVAALKAERDRLKADLDVAYQSCGDQAMKWYELQRRIDRAIVALGTHDPSRCVLVCGNAKRILEGK